MTRQRPHLDGLSKKQIAFLDRRVCGWCEMRLTATICGAMNVLDEQMCDMAERRRHALEDYRPRKGEALTG